MGVSRRQYAALRGCAESAVRKALATGRITAEADGTIDPVKADRQWDAATDPAKQRGIHARQLGADTARGTAAAKSAIGMKPVPRAAISAVNDTLTEVGADAPSGDAEGGQVSFLRARMANEVIKAQTAKVRLQKMKGDLVDRNRAVAAIFDLARRERDSWLNLPPRVAANMAAELGVEAHRMELVLDRVLRAHLAEMAEVKLEFRCGLRGHRRHPPRLAGGPRSRSVPDRVAMGRPTPGAVVALGLGGRALPDQPHALHARDHGRAVAAQPC